jgi:uncharacterized integral membrane protein (TIGR00697 family)
MMDSQPEKRNTSPLTLYQLMSASFCIIVLMANITSLKMVALPYLKDLSIPAGALFYPVSFLISDLVNECYGPEKAKLMVFITLAMNLLSLCLIQFTLFLPGESSEMQENLRLVLGSSGWRIFASLVAYVVGQILTIKLYTLIKGWTGSRFLWLSCNGSAFLSQILDTIIVDMIALYWGLGMALKPVIFIICFSYVYKVLFSLASTPLFYFFLSLIRKHPHTQKGLHAVP